MKLKAQSLLPLLANVFLVWLIQLVNDGLSAFSLLLFVPALWMVFPVFYAHYKTGFLISVITGFWWDATEPTPFGTLAVWMGCVYVLMIHLKARYELKKPLHVQLLAQVMNVLLFWGYVCTLALCTDFWVSSWVNLWLSWAVSQLVLMGVLFWYIDLQKAIFLLLRCKPVNHR